MNRRDAILAPLRILAGWLLAKLGVRAKVPPVPFDYDLAHDIDFLTGGPEPLGVIVLPRNMRWQDAEVMYAEMLRHPWEHYNGKTHLYSVPEPPIAEAVWQWAEATFCPECYPAPTIPWHNTKGGPDEKA